MDRAIDDDDGVDDVTLTDALFLFVALRLPHDQEVFSLSENANSF